MTALYAVPSLARREIVRFLRQPNRVIGALGSPLLFWLLLGSGVGRSFRAPGVEDGVYLGYVYPGVLVLILLFTAIFSTISIIEDRREGFLQSVLVAPVPRSMIVMGKILGGSALALGQALLFLALAPLAGVKLTVFSVLGTAGLLGLMAVALTGLGFFIAWRMESVQGFHAVMNFLLMPLWLLSGAIFPPEGSMAGIRWLMMLNPLTYGVNALRAVLDPTFEHGNIPLGVAVTLAFAVLTVAAASRVARGHVSGDLK